MIIDKQYIYPPRPLRDAIPFEKASVYEKYGWKAQLKFSDKRCLISVEGDNVELFTRHDNPHSYKPPNSLKAEILHFAQKILKLTGWSYLDGGLLDGKNKLFSDTIVVWDILVRENNWLLGTTYSERYNWLRSKCGNSGFTLSVNGNPIDFGIKVTDHILIPRQFDEFSIPWAEVQHANSLIEWQGPGDGEPLLEGIIYKDGNGTLEPGLRPYNNASWCSRSRVRTLRHRF